MSPAWSDGIPDVQERVAGRFRTARQLREDEVDDLVRGWESGLSVAELAVRFGVHRSTVGRYLAERGFYTLEKLRPADLERAAELYKSGWTLVQLAVEFNTTKKTIRRRLAGIGVSIRRRGRVSMTPKANPV